MPHRKQLIAAIQERVGVSCDGWLLLISTFVAVGAKTGDDVDGGGCCGCCG
jgi:hypothetical protein